ncbi:MULTISPECIES: putative quinol monooxygenase [Rhizobium/Agrobacterium group]|uniref:putative quinol monooxygenase n=1 Tax=Rhizobium/Agrobacterium group TaxID=227290 RepID=UPI000B405CC7|nr:MULTISPECIES: putative quinol monooxygenase [Rhizobium/Agrobacterium group]MCF1482305.1 antibiotic biosynthesis monooxygenase [Allorhizobium ampelinum]MVA71510.1 antibiotic biosynthesis monooxygenase [Agrobacterium vitis]NSZ41917.1 antibiotic biosynthesis monooxygenase [Agrobacterium vitis]NTA25626.1 antibiotic biosynthesis monooxygenase [Allorhizobium ampelinum]OVE96327.1 antibiotic biosynthesis monooxygenase [Allorhizobium ampelinum]
MAKVFLDGYIDVPEDRLVAVEAALPPHIELTRAEPGCISFNVTPCPDVAGRFLVSEVFADQAAFDAHQQRTRASHWFKVTKGIGRDYQIRKEEE